MHEDFPFHSIQFRMPCNMSVSTSRQIRSALEIEHEWRGVCMNKRAMPHLSHELDIVQEGEKWTEQVQGGVKSVVGN